PRAGRLGLASVVTAPGTGRATMTTLGKIFVIVNVIFSILTVGLIAAAYAARTNWKAAYDKAEANVKVAQANADTYQAEVVEARKRAQEEIKKGNDELARIRGD